MRSPNPYDWFQCNVISPFADRGQFYFRTRVQVDKVDIGLGASESQVGVIGLFLQCTVCISDRIPVWRVIEILESNLYIRGILRAL